MTDMLFFSPAWIVQCSCFLGGGGGGVVVVELECRVAGVKGGV